MSKRKIAISDCLNQEFVDFLSELSNYERNITKNVFKANAYKKAASVLGKHPIKITSGKQAKELPGIGAKISDKINEFISTGSLKKIEKIRADDTTVAINQLIRVTGIGPKKAEDLVKSGILNIEDLRKNQESLNKHQIIGLKHYEDFEKRIPRNEMFELQKIILSSTTDTEFSAEICGSFRRGTKTSGDIDILLKNNLFDSKCEKKNIYLSTFTKKLIESKFITDTLSSGDSKFMGVCRINKDGYLYRRIDIRLIPKDQYYCALLYFTGSDIFNKDMRTKALEKKYTLNEYCLRRIGATGIPGESINITCEQDVFDYLIMDYKTPEERNL